MLRRRMFSCSDGAPLRLITLNGMKASEQLTEEQVRQVRASPTSAECGVIAGHSRLLRVRQLSFDIEHAYGEFLRSLSSKEDHS